MEKTKNQIIIYTTDDGETKVEVKFEKDTLWLSQKEIAELFGVNTAAVNKHLKNIFSEGELDMPSTISKMEIVQQEGDREIKRTIIYYNLDAIIAVGYRVNSRRATAFRIWATKILKEYMVKGFALNDEQLKNGGRGSYYKELLERIRDIRSSEKMLYRQVLDIFATSIDYNPKSNTAKEFFKIMQNKIHYATHGRTAPELIESRADSTKPFMGLTHFKGNKPKKDEVLVAKNYLTDKELQVLNRFVSAYLDIAEIQALEEKPMYMKDWMTRLDDFIKLNHRDILQSAGKVSRLEAEAKALKEYDDYRKKSDDELTQVERDFIASAKKAEKLIDTGSQD